MNFDKRLTPARGDLAAAHLRGTVEAEAFVEGQVQICTVGKTWLRRRPEPEAPVETEVLFGESFTVYETKDGYAWGQANFDGYVGYVEAAHLAAPATPATHRVTASSTFLFARANLKSPVLQVLPFNALVAPDGDGEYRPVAGGYVFAGHIAPLASTVADWVASAERFQGVPYLWGGRSPLGFDCSGLVQAALSSAGIAIRRDTDMQEATFGDIVPAGLDGLKRGDLVFWKGHVGVMRDPATLLHANAHHLAVTSEPLAEAVKRIEAKGTPISSIRRLSGHHS